MYMYCYKSNGIENIGHTLYMYCYKSEGIDNISYTCTCIAIRAMVLKILVIHVLLL